MPDIGNVLAVVPARGGSKEIPLKNLAVVGGMSLLDRTLRLALDIRDFQAICVSTDHEQIKEKANQHQGVKVIQRPKELAGDRVADAPVLQHALDVMESQYGHSFDVVVMLQVTSPLRTKADIKSCLALLKSGDCEAVWTVSPTELHFHPLKQLSLTNEGRLSHYCDHGGEVIARQELEPVFHRNGCCYAIRREVLMGATSLFAPGATRAVISEGPRVNIDSPADLVSAERLLGPS